MLTDGTPDWVKAGRAAERTNKWFKCKDGHTHMFNSRWNGLHGLQMTKKEKPKTKVKKLFANLRSRWAWGLEKYLSPLGACCANMRTQVRSSISTYSVRWVAHTCNHGTGELETGWYLGSRANQPSLTGKLPVRPWLKNKADGTRERMTPVVHTHRVEVGEVGPSDSPSSP